MGGHLEDVALALADLARVAEDGLQVPRVSVLEVADIHPLDFDVHVAEAPTETI